MNRYIFYRITSSVNQKPRLDHFSKLECLESLLAAFPNYRVVCVADNCDQATFDLLQKRHFYKLIRTNLGNAASFNYLLNHELILLKDSDLLYFAEDDYLYREGASDALEEGLEIFDYVTLYDHPDKYSDFSAQINPLVCKGMLSEVTQVSQGKKCLWRTTNSTTMTFGCIVKTIRKDFPVWNLLTQYYSIPRDFYIWILLTCPQRNFFTSRLNLSMVLLLSNVFSILRGKRLLAVAVPSFSAHLEQNMLPKNFDTDFAFNSRLQA